MGGERALQQALDLAATPGLGPLLRQQSLPDDIAMVIRVASGSAEALQAAVRLTGRDERFLTEAAALYLQQVLFFTGADAYRTLGVSPTASQEAISQNMRWLMQWLHPDRDRNAWDSAFAERVTAAWDDLKSPGRRSNYDRWHGVRAAPKRRSRRNRMPWIAQPTGPSSTGFRFPRIVAVVVAGALVAAVLFLPGFRQMGDSTASGIAISPESLAATPQAGRRAD